MMLDKLLETIETLKARIREHDGYFRAGGKPEARTRAALIDPVLSVLEWDVTDPGLVEIEPKTIDGWADYALLGKDGNPVFFIEAKKLADRKSDMKQVVSYLIEENANKQTALVRYCAWTNGDTWEIYDTIDHKVAMKLTISHESAAQCALKFLFLWRRSMRDGWFSVPFVGSPRLEATSVEHSPPETESPSITPPAPDGPIQDTYDEGVRESASPRSDRAKGRREQKRPQGHGAQIGTPKYHRPVLRVLRDMGDGGGASEVLERVHQLVEPELTDWDRDKDNSGIVRWQHGVRSALDKTKRDGLIERDPVSKVYRITEKGREYLRS